MGDDSFFGGYGFDLIRGGSGGDRLYGGDAIDPLFGNESDDSISGGRGDDSFFNGGDGPDLLFGKSSRTFLAGGAGNDISITGDGNCGFGCSGQDWFLFDGHSLGSGGSGGPIVRDFDGVSQNDANGADKLVFASGLETDSFA